MPARARRGRDDRPLAPGLPAPTPMQQPRNLGAGERDVREFPGAHRRADEGVLRRSPEIHGANNQGASAPRGVEAQAPQGWWRDGSVPVLRQAAALRRRGKQRAHSREMRDERMRSDHGVVVLVTEARASDEDPLQVRRPLYYRGVRGQVWAGDGGARAFATKARIHGLFQGGHSRRSLRSLRNRQHAGSRDRVLRRQDQRRHDRHRRGTTHPARDQGAVVMRKGGDDGGANGGTRAEGGAMSKPKKPKPRKRPPTPPLLSRLEDAARAGEKAKPEHVIRLCESLNSALALLIARHECSGARCQTCAVVNRLEDGK